MPTMTNSTLWQYTLKPEDEGKKYQEILAGRFHFSRRLLQRLKQGEKVWVNGRFSYLSARGHAGDMLTVNLGSPEQANLAPVNALCAQPGPDPLTAGAPMPIEVLYEDGYLLAVNKPAGRVVHPTPRYPSGTLGNDVLAYWANRGETHPFRPVHRIDRNTSGVMLVAKNHFAHQQLAWQLGKGLVQKRYLGFVSGRVVQDSGTLDSPIGLAGGSFIKREIRLDGAPAETRYRVRRRYGQATLLEFELITGRTHQIRAHCEGMGHPLLGDDLYGGDTSQIQRQALHSFIYSFRHPVTSQKIQIRAPFPQDLRRLAVFLAAKPVD